MKFSAIAIAVAAMSAGVNGFAVNNRAASCAVRNVSLSLIDWFVSHLLMNQLSPAFGLRIEAS